MCSLSLSPVVSTTESVATSRKKPMVRRERGHRLKIQSSMIDEEFSEREEGGISDSSRRDRSVVDI